MIDNSRFGVWKLGLIGFVLPGAKDGEFFHNAFRGKDLGSFLRLDELGLFGFVFWGRSGAQYWCNSFWHRRLHWFWP